MGARNLEDTINDYKTKNESLEVQVNEVNNDCAKMGSELNDLRRQIEEKEALNAQMLRNKNSMTQTNDELKRHLEEETKTELQRTLTKSNNEVVVWRNKYETDAVQRTEELEEAKKKLVGRLQESEEQVEAAQARCGSL